MDFVGRYTRRNFNELFLVPPIFSDKDKIIVLDMDGVLKSQRESYVNGKRNGNDRYSLHNQARRIVERALGDSLKVVFWSLQPNVLTEMQEWPFSEVHQRIAGVYVLNEEYVVKNLGSLTHNLSNLAAIEDAADNEQTFFFPRSRVIMLERKDDFMKKYLEAREMVMRDFDFSRHIPFYTQFS